MAGEDAIDVLIGQHQQVSKLLDEVRIGPVEERQARFDELRELLAVHETAEELILRPVVRRRVPDGDAVADARIGEENQSKDALADLEKLDATSGEFLSAFIRFAEDVTQHAHNEETYEFPVLREHVDAEDLAAMKKQIAVAESLAPTHPHPSARSTAANVVLGPFASLLDRARDAMSSG